MKNGSLIKTKYQFPPNVEYLVSLGDKFNIPYTKKTFPMKQMLIDIEFIISNLEDKNSKIEM